MNEINANDLLAQIRTLGRELQTSQPARSEVAARESCCLAATEEAQYGLS